MSFSSLFFVLLFLPVFLAVYVLMPGIRTKNAVLLLASLLFYAFGGVRYLLLLAVMVLIAWIAGLHAAGNRKVLVISVILFLAVLGFFKYTGFFLRTVDSIFHLKGTAFDLALPLGISFYIFKLISYVADVYHKRIQPEKNYLMLLLYAGLFHHVLQGPIVRYADTKEELRSRQMTLSDFSAGCFRFCTGLAKKTILADSCGALADQLLPAASGVAGIPTAGIWIGSIVFTLQMYLDFSAYSDMAIALGQMVGFHYKENFNYPYTAITVRDFWRRWHISLSTFFRDYVYIPLGGNRTRHTTLNLLVVWFLTGLWHGADWNFILWGLYYFVFIVLENAFRGAARYKAVKVSQHHRDEDEDEIISRADIFKKRFGHFWGHLYTLFVVNLGWVLFRFTDFSQLNDALAGFWGMSGAGFWNASVAMLLENNIFLLIVSIICCSPIFIGLGRWIEVFTQEKRMSKMPYYVLRAIIAILLLLISLNAMAGSTYTPFLYNQF